MCLPTDSRNSQSPRTSTARIRDFHDFIRASVLPDYDKLLKVVDRDAALEELTTVQTNADEEFELEGPV
jgi:hypothetical protein